MRTFLITEAGRKIGFGHLMRCTSLYQAFEEKGISPELIVHGDDSILGVVSDQRVHRFPWQEETQRLLQMLQAADTVIVDSYLAAPALYTDIARTARRCVYLDDDRRMDYPPGIILNGAFLAQEMGYPSREDVTYWLGPQYIPLRKVFWRQEEKNIPERVASLLISMGGDDQHDLTPRILRSVCAAYPSIKKYVVVGQAFANGQAISSAADGRTELVKHPDAVLMKNLMKEADVAITAGGQTLYELASVGTPVIAVGVADNQQHNLRAGERCGFVDVAGWYADADLLARIQEKLSRLSDVSVRRQRSVLGRALVDGRGALRVAEALMGQKGNGALHLRQVSPGDCYDLWQWRNHPEVRRWCFQTEEIAYEQHQAWFAKKIRMPQDRIYIAENGDGDKVGQVRMDMNGENAASININLNPQAFGRGYGSRIIRLATETFFNEMPQMKEIVAEIVEDNTPSKKAFEKAGFFLSHVIHKAGKETAVFKFQRNRDEALD